MKFYFTLNKIHIDYYIIKKVAIKNIDQEFRKIYIETCCW